MIQQALRLLAPAVTLLLLLLPPAFSQYRQKCYVRADLIFAIDVTSSNNHAELRQVKALAKEIASQFKIGASKSRIALISFADTSRLLLNFEDTLSLEDFNRAVDRLELRDVKPNMRNLLSFVRRQIVEKSGLLRIDDSNSYQCSAVLLMIKDGRYEDVEDRYLEDSESEVKSYRADADFLRSHVRVFVQSIALGGSYPYNQLRVLQNAHSNLYTSLASVKAMATLLYSHQFCTACVEVMLNLRPPLVYKGPCLDRMRYVLSSSSYVNKSLMTSYEPCRIDIRRHVEKCTPDSNPDFDICDKVERTVSGCDASDNHMIIEDAWKYFDARRQSCRWKRELERLPCNRGSVCTNRMHARFVILLDMTRTSQSHFATMKEAAKAIVNQFHFDENPDLRVGVTTFHSKVGEINRWVRLGDKLTKAQILAAVDAIPSDRHDFGDVRDNFEAIKTTIKDMAAMEGGWNNLIVLITSGPTTATGSSIRAIFELIVEHQITVFAIGIGNVNLDEMKDITAPESNSHLILIKDFSTLTSSATKLAGVMCIQMSPPNPRLCAESITLQRVSKCSAHSSNQLSFVVDFKFNVQNQCEKRRKITLLKNCKVVVTDPISGNERHGEPQRRSMCQQFEQNKAFPSDPFFVTPTKVTQCVAADFSCKPVGAAIFSCRDDRGEFSKTCRCVSKYGETILEFEPTP